MPYKDEQKRKEYRRLYYLKNKEKEQQQHKDWYNDNRAKHYKLCRHWAKNHMEALREYHNNWYHKHKPKFKYNPDKDRVRKYDNTKAKKTICSNCGFTDNLEIHHLSYTESGNYIVLCRACHGAIHSKHYKLVEGIQGGQENFQF